MKISNVLKKARVHLRTNRFLCNAIDDCDIYPEDKRKAKNYVHDLLGQCLTVEVWLNNQAKINIEDINMINMRSYRLRWVNHMINELEKEGK
jgi:hypothetical protein